MNDTTSALAVTGGRASVRIYAADEIVFLSADATLLTAADELNRDQIGLVVLGTREWVVGVLSERDVVRAVADHLDPATTPAMRVASTSVVLCEADATVEEVAELMMVRYVRHVLLEHRGRLVGIVSARDLLGAYAMSS